MYTWIIIASIVLLIYILYKPYGEGFTSLSYELPRITWTYWEGDSIPETVQLTHKRTKEKLPNWDVRLVTKDTLAQYIDPSTIPSNINDYGVQHRADWYRVALLRAHGGVWLDAAILINSGSAVEELYNESVAERSEFTGFTLGEEKELYIENWFMMAPKHSEVISKLYDEFTHAIEIGFMEYKSQIEKDNNINIISRIYTPKSTYVYLTQHACIQAVIQTRIGRKPRLVLKPAEESMFKIQTDCNWDYTCIVTKINTGDAKSIPYLKLRGGESVALKTGYFNEAFIPSERVGWSN